MLWMVINITCFDIVQYDSNGDVTHSQSDHDMNVIGAGRN